MSPVLPGLLIALLAIPQDLEPGSGPPPGRQSVADQAREILVAGAGPSCRTRWAGRILAGLPPESAVAICRAAISRGTWAARRQAAESLYFLPHPDRSRLLAALAKDPSWAVRGEALRTAALLGESTGLEPALAGLRDPVWAARWQAARSLAAYPPTSLSPDRRRRRLAALLEAVQDLDQEVRKEAERVLLVHPEAGALDLYLDIFDRRNERRPLVRRRALAAARALYAIGGDPVKRALRDRLDHPHLRTRIFSARLLQLLGEDLTPRLHGSGLIADILEGWSDATGPVRAAAEALANSLASAAARAALPLFTKGAGVGALNEIMSWVVDSLGSGEPGDPSGVALLADLLDSKDLAPPARAALARALRRLGKKGPRRFLESAYRRELKASLRRRDEGASDGLGGYRADLLAGLGGTAPYPDFDDVLAAALGDPAVQVRRLAALLWIRTSGVSDPYERLAGILAAHRSDHLGRDFLRQVARLRDEPSFDFLMAAAQGTFSKKAKLRVNALNALTSVTWAESRREKLVAWLRRRLESEPDPSARTRMVMLLGNLDMTAAVDLVARVALSQAERTEVRIQAVNKLGASRLEAAASALRRIIRRPDRPEGAEGKGETARLKAAALRALFALALPEDRDDMVKVLETGPDRTRRFALTALEKLRDPATKSAVESLVQNGLMQPELRARGLRVLAAIGGAGAADFLFQRLREETLPELRLGALEALSLLDSATYVDRLVHYLSMLEEARRNDATARDLFSELLGELGMIPADAVTRFLVDFLLENQIGPGVRPTRSRRSPPLEVAARGALLGHRPERVRSVLNDRLEVKIENGVGLGIHEGFYLGLIRHFTHPTRQADWGVLALDLCRRALATPPGGSKTDFHSRKLEAELAFEYGRFDRAAAAYEHLHRLAMLEGYLDRENTGSALADHPLGRLAGLGRIAEALALGAGREAEALERVKDGIRAAPHDVQTLLTAVQALALIGTGFDLALRCLKGLGPRARGGVAALTRYDLGLALLAAGRKPEAAALLKTAFLNHAPLRQAARSEARLKAAFDAAELDALLDPPGH